MRVIGPDVGHAQDIDQELRQLVGLRGHRGGPVLEVGRAELARHAGVLVPDRADARAGRGHDRVVALERLDEGADDGHRLARVTGIDVHLPAAGLGERRVDIDPGPAQHLDRREPDVGLERVDQTGREQRDPHRRAACGW